MVLTSLVIQAHRAKNHQRFGGQIVGLAAQYEIFRTGHIIGVDLRCQVGASQFMAVSRVQIETRIAIIIVTIGDVAKSFAGSIDATADR